jgi:hypothetical protein
LGDDTLTDVKISDRFRLWSPSQCERQLRAPAFDARAMRGAGLAPKCRQDVEKAKALLARAKDASGLIQPDKHDQNYGTYVTNHSLPIEDRCLNLIGIDFKMLCQMSAELPAIP